MLANLSQDYRRANHDPRTTVSSYLIEFRQTHDRYDRARGLLPALHVRIEIGASGNELRLRPGVGDNLHRLRDGARYAVIEFGKTHHGSIYVSNEHTSSKVVVGIQPGIR